VAALALTVPNKAGIAWTPAAVSASDTVTSAVLGAGGCWFIVINGGGSPDTVGYTDPGTTPSGGAPAAFTNSVTNATTEAMYLSPKLVDSSGILTITHSFITSVTYILLPVTAP